MPRFHLLAVEDSPEYQSIIARTLSEYKVTICATVEEALALLEQFTFDLLIIDINLPDRDGFSLLAEARALSTTSSTPILCLTGRKEITDKITAFSLGADDYLTKPFDPLELRARVDAKLRQLTKQNTDKTVTLIGDIEIDHGRHRVAVLDGSKRIEVSITPTEFKLLSCLARRPEQVFTRDQLLVAAWGEDASVLDRVVDTHICLLRKKLGSYSHCIKAVSGIGYKIFVPTKKMKAV